MVSNPTSKMSIDEQHTPGLKRCTAQAEFQQESITLLEPTSICNWHIFQKLNQQKQYDKDRKKERLQNLPLQTVCIIVTLLTKGAQRVSSSLQESQLL